MTYTPPSDPGQPIQNPGAPQYSTYGTPGGYAAPGSSYGTTAYAPKPKSDKKTLGLWGMILGISSLIIPLGLNGIAGIVLGIFGLVKENSKGMSITGIITGAIGAFIWAPIFWALIVPGIFLLMFVPSIDSYPY